MKCSSCQFAGCTEFGIKQFDDAPHKNKQKTPQNNTKGQVNTMQYNINASEQLP